MITAAVMLGALAYIAGALLFLRHRWVKTETARLRGVKDGLLHGSFCTFLQESRSIFGEQGFERYSRQCNCAAPLWIAALWPLALLGRPLRYLTSVAVAFVHPRIELPDHNRIRTLEKELDG
ncbi:hypothetical protein C6N75_09795 [Streptomyces solincola]|uniref:Uncharacterized protein n=1 Tax=Streptomyces solincola TaxID=2100817 RepID=A0A2S9PYF6_9ACTN|nr:hypothetical protein [Streptomyces solincola]PRH79367.1 hypothetical protein C6N75_09795 [Streptomyces solincola]